MNVKHERRQMQKDSIEIAVAVAAVDTADAAAADD